MPMHGSKLLKIIQLFVERRSVELNLQPKTIKNYRETLNRFMRFLGMEKAFTLENTRDYLLYLQENGWSPSGWKTELTIVRVFERYCIEEGYMKNSVTKKIKTPTIKKKKRDFVSEEQAENVIFAGTALKSDENHLAHHVKTEMQLALRFMLRTGLRISEAIQMSGNDLHLDDEEPQFDVHSKGGDTDTLPLPKDMIDELRERKNKKRLFEITEKGCNRAMTRGCKTLNLPKQTCHSLRHIFALTRLRRGEPLQLVSRLLRHTSVMITDKYYSHLVVGDLDATMQNSRLITKGLTDVAVYDRASNAIRRLGIDRLEDFVVEQVRSENELIIKIRRKV